MKNMNKIESLNNSYSEKLELEELIEEMLSREEFACTLEGCVGDAELI